MFTSKGPTYKYNQYQHVTAAKFLLIDSNGNELMAVLCSCLAEMQQKQI
jgi:hypothetical protein